MVAEIIAHLKGGLQGTNPMSYYSIDMDIVQSIFTLYFYIEFLLKQKLVYYLFHI